MSLGLSSIRRTEYGVMARISIFLYLFENRQWEGHPGVSDGTMGCELLSLCMKKAQGGTLGDTAGAEGPQTFSCLDSEEIKAWGFLCLESLLRGTGSSCYFVIAPRWNNFKDWGIWDSYGKLEVEPVHCERGMWNCEGVLAPAQVMRVWLPGAPGWSDKKVSLTLKLRPLKCALGGSSHLWMIEVLALVKLKWCLILCVLFSSSKWSYPCMQLQLTYADKVDLAEKCIHILRYDWFNLLLMFHSTEGALELLLKALYKVRNLRLTFLCKVLIITEAEYFSILHRGSRWFFYWRNL